jgi:hypothetical protein
MERPESFAEEFGQGIADEALVALVKDMTKGHDDSSCSHQSGGAFVKRFDLEDK